MSVGGSGGRGVLREGHWRVRGLERGVYPKERGREGNGGERGLGRRGCALRR